MHYKENNVVSTGVVLSLACLLFYYFPFFEISLLSSFLFFHFNSNIELKQNFFTHFLDVYSPSLFCIIFTFIFRKTNLSYPLIRTRTCGYQGVRNVRFWENLARFLFLKQPFWDSPFCLIIDVFVLIILQCLIFCKICKNLSCIDLRKIFLVNLFCEFYDDNSTSSFSGLSYNLQGWSSSCYIVTR